MKKLSIFNKVLVGTITTAAVGVSVAAVVVAVQNKKEGPKAPDFKMKHLRILNLGDSVAHGDYTWQMNEGQKRPLLLGPPRVEGYYGFMVNQLKHDGVMDSNSFADYRTSASGARTDELAGWLKTNDYYEGLNGYVTYDKMIKHFIDKGKTKPEAKRIAKRYGMHKGMTKKEEHDWNEGDTNSKYLNDIGIAETYKVRAANHSHAMIYGTGLAGKRFSEDKSTEQKNIKLYNQDSDSLWDHVRNTDLITITTGGNDLFKILNIFGIPFTQIGNGELTVAKMEQTIKAVMNNKKFNKALSQVIAEIKKVKSDLASVHNPIEKVKKIVKAKEAITEMLFNGLIGKGKLGSMIASIDKAIKYGKFRQILSLGDVKDKGTGKQQTKVFESIKNSVIQIIKKIRELNPNAKVVFGDYLFPLMHFPKLIRNIAKPIFDKISIAVQVGIKKAGWSNVIFAKSDVKNWEESDQKDINKNVLADAHPTLHGYSILAQNMFKAINNKWGTNFKLRNNIVNDFINKTVSEHKIDGQIYKKAVKAHPTDPTVWKKLKADGTLGHKLDMTKPYLSSPYQSKFPNNGYSKHDPDYAYGVKNEIGEKLAHKDFLIGRISIALMEAVGDSILLKNEYHNYGHETAIPTDPNKLSLSDLTVLGIKEHKKLHPGESLFDTKNLTDEATFERTIDKNIKRLLFRMPWLIEGIH